MEHKLPVKNRIGDPNTRRADTRFFLPQRGRRSLASIALARLVLHPSMSSARPQAHDQGLFASGKKLFRSAVLTRSLCLYGLVLSGLDRHYSCMVTRRSCFSLPRFKERRTYEPSHETGFGRVGFERFDGKRSIPSGTACSRFCCQASAS